MTPINVLSLGAGIQSSALLLMSCDGFLPKLDHAIFADTGWEPVAVYKHLEWLKEKASAAGIPLHVVSTGNIKSDMEVSRTASGMIADSYLHRSRQPLDQVDFNETQGDMFENECAGVCGV